jgi:HEAT repeat protein
MEPLNTVSAKLGSRCAEFVLDEGDPAVLLEIAKYGSVASKALAGLGKHYAFAYQKDELSERVRTQRDQAYRAVDPSCIPPLVRLGELLEAADSAKEFTPPCGAHAPLWLQHLMCDVLLMPDKERSYRSDDKLWADFVERRSWITFSFLCDLAAFDGENVGAVFELIFCRVKYDFSHLKLLLPMPDLPEGIKANSELFAAEAGRFPADAKVAVMSYLAERGLYEGFYPMLVGFAADSSRTVRDAAGKLIGCLDADSRLELLSSLICSEKPALRSGAAALVARIPGEMSKALLERSMSTESLKSVREAMAKALADHGMASTKTEDDSLSLPPQPDITEDKIADSALDELREKLTEATLAARKAAEKEREDNKSLERSWNWAQTNYHEMQKFGPGDLRLALSYLNGEGGSSPDSRLGHIMGSSILKRPDFGLRQALRLVVGPRLAGAFWMNNYFIKWRESHKSVVLDLRMIAAAWPDPDTAGLSVASACLGGWWGLVSRPQDELDPKLVWPFFAERPELLEMAIGMIPSKFDRPSVSAAIGLLAIFPSIPMRYISRLLELALGDAKTDRAEAQGLLSRLPGIGLRITEALGSAKQESRSIAAEWLARLGDKDALPAIRERLKVEKKETVRAALLSALEGLGGDASEYLAPCLLLADAEKGLATGMPKGLDWFPFAALLECSWKNGGSVPPAILTWWIALAAKLKEPGGNALFRRYLALLEDRDRQALGIFVLKAFVAYDTRSPSLDEANDYAKANVDSRLAMYKQYATSSWGAEYGKYTYEMVFEQLKREKLATYLGTAIGEKGILAIASGSDGTEAAVIARAYMKDHYPRYHQVASIVEALAASDDPAAIQLVLSIARRYRTTSVRDRAKELIAEIAERKGWSAEELADRTIPTGGLDENGILELDFGRRSFEVRVGADFKPVIRNEKGELLKTLPEPNQADDATKAKEAKESLSSLKKTIKQVIDLQSGRLYEAMCLQRPWKFTEWKELLLEHPLMGFLVQRLVWTAGDKCFRPTEDHALIGANDSAIEVPGNEEIRIAHGSLLESDVADAWKRHFSDYRMEPLFDQFRAARAPELKEGESNEFSDREGWMSDSFTLRGVLTKLGYQRGQAEDGGVFVEYWKDFMGAGIKVVIEFTGSALPETNVPAALKTLSFVGSASRQFRRLELSSIRPVLLGEAYADYLQAADACIGFDPDWERKAAW